MTLRRILSTSGALAGLLVVAMATHACAQGEDKPAEPAADAAAPAASIATSLRGKPLTWGTPDIAGRSGDYTATLRPSGSSARSGKPISVRLDGIGFPGVSRKSAVRFVGPGVAIPWTQIAHNRYDVSIGHRGSTLALRIWSRGGNWRAKVDGRLVNRKPRPVGSDYALHTIALKFPGEPKRHVVDFELRGGAWLAGVATGEGDDVWLPKKPKGPSIYWLGDSFFAGMGAKSPGYDDLVHVASDRLGLSDVTVDALGGTGFARDNTAAKFDDYLTRVKHNISKRRAQPRVIVVGGSINDVAEQPRAVEANARKLFARLAKTAPDAKVVVVAFAPRYPVPANFALRNRAVLKAAADAPNVVGALDLPAEMAERGDRAAALQGKDGHPSSRGHVVYGRVIANYIAKRIPAANAR